jgi:hypothetical protein
MSAEGLSELSVMTVSANPGLYAGLSILHFSIESIPHNQPDFGHMPAEGFSEKPGGAGSANPGVYAGLSEMAISALWTYLCRLIECRSGLPTCGPLP